MSERHRGVLELIAAGLYLVSLALPAMVLTSKPFFGGEPSDQTLSGIACLMYGWFVPAGWVANPLLLAAAITHACKRHHAAVVLASLALVSAGIGPVFLACYSDMQLRHPHVGYVVWVASIILVIIAAARAPARARPQQLSSDSLGYGHSSYTSSTSRTGSTSTSGSGQPSSSS